MICDNCIHNEVCEKAHFENHCGYKHTEADIIIPELEKIKEKINEKDRTWMPKRFVNEILDTRIKELKGENNDLPLSNK